MRFAKLLGFFSKTMISIRFKCSSSFSICASLCIWCVNIYSKKWCLNVLKGLNYDRYLDINYAFPCCARYCLLRNSHFVKYKALSFF